MSGAQQHASAPRSLPERIARGRVMIAEARARGQDTTGWERHLAELETAAAALAVHSPSLALRPYQREALDAISASPHRRPIVALPTGTGKTVIFAHLIAQVAARGELAVVLVHHDELVQQVLEKLAVVAPGLAIGVVKAERDEYDAAVVVGSVQTLARPHRREKLARDVALVIADEAHHALAPSWRAAVLYAAGRRARSAEALMGQRAATRQPTMTITLEDATRCPVTMKARPSACPRTFMRNRKSTLPLS